MSSKVWIGVGVVAVATVIGLVSLGHRGNLSATDSSAPATARPATASSVVATASASPSLPDGYTTEPLEPDVENSGPVPADQVAAAKQQVTAFVTAYETYGPNVTVGAAVDRARQYMTSSLAEQYPAGEQGSDAEYDTQVAKGLTRIVSVDKLTATRGISKAGTSTLTLVAAIRTAWVPATNPVMPTSQPTQRFVLHTVCADGGTWGVASYEPAA